MRTKNMTLVVYAIALGTLLQTFPARTAYDNEPLPFLAFYAQAYNWKALCPHTSGFAGLTVSPHFSFNWDDWFEPRLDALNDLPRDMREAFLRIVHAVRKGEFLEFTNDLLEMPVGVYLLRGNVSQILQRQLKLKIDGGAYDWDGSSHSFCLNFHDRTYEIGCYLWVNNHLDPKGIKVWIAVADRNPDDKFFFLELLDH